MRGRSPPAPPTPSGAPSSWARRCGSGARPAPGSAPRPPPGTPSRWPAPPRPAHPRGAPAPGAPPPILVLVDGHRRDVLAVPLEEHAAVGPRDQRAERRALLEHDESAGRAGPVADRDEALEDVDERVAAVAVALEHET